MSTADIVVRGLESDPNVMNWKRNGNKPPYDLAKHFAEHASAVDFSVPLNFVSTADIIGGNSGSPVVNRAGEIVGLVFDRNIESLVGDFVYVGETNRTVAVHTAAMTEVLRKLYNAPALVKELLEP